MKRYMIPVNSTRVALKKITKINAIKLTELQEKLSYNLGYKNWKELIHVNKNTEISTWITFNDFCKIIDNIFGDKLDYSERKIVIYILSKVFMVDFLCLKEVYGNISDNDYYYIKNGLFNTFNKNQDEFSNLIFIQSPIILNKKSNDINIKIEDIFDRTFSPIENDYLYIYSDNLIENFQKIIYNNMRMGLKYYIFNYPYDEKNVRLLCRLMFANHTIVLSGDSALMYKESMNKFIHNFKKSNQ